MLDIRYRQGMIYRTDIKYRQNLKTEFDLHIKERKYTTLQSANIFVFVHCNRVDVFLPSLVLSRNLFAIFIHGKKYSCFLLRTRGVLAYLYILARSTPEIPLVTIFVSN